MNNFFHRLFNPHCPDCMQQERDLKVCATCEVLQLQVEKLQYTNDQLMKRILEPKTEEVKILRQEELSAVPSTSHIPWRVRQQLLEKEDREKARLMKDAAQPIDKIEKEVLG